MVEDGRSICFIKASRMYDFIQGDAVGGAERQIYLLAKEFSNRDYDASIITESFEGPAETFVNGIRIINGPESAKTDASVFRKIRDYWSALRKSDADYYYVRGDIGVLTVVNLFTHITGGQVIFNVSNDSHIQTASNDVSTLLSERVFEYSLNHISFNIAQTEHQQRLLKQNYSADSYVVPNGYPVPPEKDLVPMTNREYILWVGRLDREQKKPMRYLDLAEQLPDIMFRMIGPVNEEDDFHVAVRSRAEGLDNAEFVGFVPPEEIHSHYSNAIALVNTSESEGFPNSFLEAWRYGTPIVSLYHNMDGLLENRVCGLLSGNFKALVQDIELLANDQEFATELSKQAREIMKSNYSIEAVVDRYEALFAENK